jgi:hypothetical protein
MTPCWRTVDAQKFAMTLGRRTILRHETIFAGTPTGPTRAGATHSASGAQLAPPLLICFFDGAAGQDDDRGGSTLATTVKSS